MPTICIHKDCTKRCIYGKPKSKKSEYCFDHKPEDYINVNSKTCCHSECNRQPLYGKPGSTKSEYCFTHKPSDVYIDVKNKKCVHLGCDKQPNYGKSGSIREYCSEHKPSDEYIDVKNKICRQVGCKKVPSYGKPESKLREYCSEHKPSDYIDVKSKICIHKGCVTIAIFGNPESKLREYCYTHKPSDYIDVVSKICGYSGCTTHATYGILFQPKTHCAKHKTPNMYTKNKPICEYEKCKETPCYTDKKDSYPLRCEEHQEEDDTLVSESNCIICDQVLFIKSDTKMCNICAKVDITKIRHEKELKIKTLLEEEEIDFIHDRTSDPGCHKHRPDFLIDCETHYIVIEVDENQHSSYADECEIARMVNIQQGFGGMRVLFIRFNPDGYTDSDKKKVRAGITLTRKKRLVSLIKSSILHPPPHLLSVAKLYYDGDNGTVSITEIDVDNLFQPRNEIEDFIFDSDEEKDGECNDE